MLSTGVTRVWRVSHVAARSASIVTARTYSKPGQDAPPAAQQKPVKLPLRPPKAGVAAPDVLGSQLKQLQETLKNAPIVRTSPVTPGVGYSQSIQRVAAPLTPHLSMKKPDVPPGSPAEEEAMNLDDLPVVHVLATNNNTFVTITSPDGKIIATTSCGLVGFQNAKKNSSFAGQQVAFSAAKKAYSKGGVREVRLMVKGTGVGRQSCVRGLTAGGLRVVSVTDATPIPHNGCRPKKARRL